MRPSARTAKIASTVALLATFAISTNSYAGWFSDSTPAKKVVAKVKAAPAAAVSKVQDAPLNIQAQVEDVLAKVNEIYGQVEDSRPLMNVIKDGKIINDLQDIMVFLNETRADYEQFANSGVQSFSQDVSGLLYDFGDIASIMQVADGMDTRLAKAEDLINRMPPQLMYVMHEALGASIADMREQVLDISANLDFMRDMPSNRQLLSAPQQHQASLCPIVNHKATKVSYQVVKGKVAVLNIALDYINEMQPDDLNVGATAVAGATATVSKYPPKYITQSLKTIGDYIALRLETIHDIAEAVCE